VEATTFYRDRLLRIGHYYLGTDLKHVKGGWSEPLSSCDRRPDSAACTGSNSPARKTRSPPVRPPPSRRPTWSCSRRESRERRQRRSRSRRSSRGRRHRDPRLASPTPAPPTRAPRPDRGRSRRRCSRSRRRRAARSGRARSRVPRNVRNTTDIDDERGRTGTRRRPVVDRGFDVDLDDPDHVLRALFAAGERDDHEAVPGADGGDSAVCALGWVAVEAARDFAPKPTDRPFFQPGSMSPTDARAYANLAGAAPGRTLLDPMCGTGGLPLEAGIVGSDVIACDAQTKMVRGTRENLREYLNTALDDSGPDWHVARGDATAPPARRRGRRGRVRRPVRPSVEDRAPRTRGPRGGALAEAAGSRPEPSWSPIATGAAARARARPAGRSTPPSSVEFTDRSPGTFSCLIASERRGNGGPRATPTRGSSGAIVTRHHRPRVNDRSAIPGG